MKKEQNVLIASAEIVPFAKTGGLADVVGALPGALEKVGAKVNVVMPLYKTIDQKKHKMKVVGEKFFVPMAGENVEITIKQGKLPGVKGKAFFVECDKYFDRDGMYQENGESYHDNDERFALFSRAVVEMMKMLDYKPDIVHCNDWQTGLIPTYMKVIYGNDEFYKDIPTVMTVHNIAYQGIFPSHTMEKIGLPWEIFTPEGVEFWGHLNYLKAGLVFADVINTVSETYAREIQSSKEFGRGLEGLLNFRSKDLYGILNGIDYRIWDPAKDDYISSNYDEGDLRGKSRCKKSLQKDQELKTGKVPLIGIVSRLADQKGFDIVAGALEKIMEMDVQLVILGTGDPKYHEMLQEMTKKYGNKMSVNLRFDEQLAHMIYAGSDIFLMPSRFEPCGLGQMIALKYGTLPLVHKTGGLADTVTDYTEDPNQGNGFVFDEYSSEALLYAVERAVEVYSNKRKWNTIVKACMKVDHSWKNAVKKYMDLYEKAAEKKVLVAV
ncbi:MAG: glycogen synthase GlgA [Candidatus Eremiobacteraeota bacterium]|nr:glycogen synthase GlgA [Candidatus Eremiobacteraeota bacterium]